MKKDRPMLLIDCKDGEHHRCAIYLPSSIARDETLVCTCPCHSDVEGTRRGVGNLRKSEDGDENEECGVGGKGTKGGVTL